ncbi:MAG: M1 family aminopeptidase [Chitinophagales bacterium]
MFLKIFRFEVRYWFKQPMGYIFLFINALLIFGATSSDSVTVGGSVGNVNKNAPFVVENFYAVMSIISLLMVTAFLNVAAARDFNFNTHQIIFSTPLKKFSFLMGRFCGAAFVAIVPFLGVSIGNILGAMMPWVDADRVGPTYLDGHLMGLLVFIIPNILFAGAFIFAIAALTRSTIYSFIATILLLVGYGIANGLVRDLKNEYIGTLIDPFGIRTFSVATKYWTVADKNTLSLGLTGIMLVNRIIWLIAAGCILTFTFSRFSFTERSGRKKRSAPSEKELLPAYGMFQSLPTASFSASASQQFKQFVNQVRLDFWGIMKSTAFIVIILAGIINMGSSMAFVTDSGYGNKSFPVTYTIIDTIRGTLYLFLVAIITFYTGVLAWKERDARVSDIYDALPFAKWISPVSKLVSMILIVTVILVVALLTGVITQTLYGFHDYKIGEYLTELLALDLLSFSFLIVLSLFIHTVINNRYIAYFVFIAFLIVNLFAWRALDITSNMVVFGGVPAHTYSDMNGLNPYLPGLTWFNIYWFLFSGLLVMKVIFFWVRGKGTTFKNRWNAARASFMGSYRWITFLLLVLWIGTAGFVFYNTKVLNHYNTPLAREIGRAEYERMYKKYEDINQPRVTDIRFTIDLYPESQDLNVVATARAWNAGSKPIDSLHFSMLEGFQVTIDLPNAEMVLDDEEHLYRIYKLQQPLQPGDSMTFKTTSSYHCRGFENEVRFTQIVANGSFFNNADVLPQIGYQAGNEVEDKNRRKKCKLPERDRMPPLVRNCTDKCINTYLSNSSDWVNVETVMSTSKDQVIVAPGSLLKEWTEGDRHYFHYKLDHKSMNFYSFISAQYEVKRDKFKDIDVEVYYTKGHEYNIDKMMNSLKSSLKYFTENFGPYYHNQARIIEFPRYASFAQAFPGTMPYSESIGFIANLEDPDDIDMVYYVVAHEMGHQLWAHQVIGANMQGATLLSETMAQYSALMVMEDLYGKEQMHKFLKYEMDRYLRSRGTETIRETPLLNVENQGYIHYRKGSVVMYYLKEMIGEDNINKALKNMVDSFAYRNPPYPNSYNLVDRFEHQTPDSLKYLIKDLFYDMTVFNNRTLDASYKKTGDNKFEVTINAQSEKFKADSLGKETKVGISDWIEIGALAAPAEGKKIGIQLYSQRVKVSSEKNTYTFVVNQQPDKAGIDPNYYLVDRMPDDNLKDVEEKK